MKTYSAKPTVGPAEVVALSSIEPIWPTITKAAARPKSAHINLDCRLKVTSRAHRKAGLLRVERVFERSVPPALGHAA
jgi:hypothetical protein